MTLIHLQGRFCLKINVAYFNFRSLIKSLGDLIKGDIADDLE